MREAARALDDVSDHLGEVLRHADELLAEWSRFGAQVRTQVDREAQAIGGAVDEAVARVASSGVDRAIAERLRALTGEIERLEQRARAASRAVAEQHTADRRVLWAVVAGVVVANALLVLLLLRKPEPVVLPAPQPVKLEVPAPVALEPAPAVEAQAGSADNAPAGAGAAGANGAATAVTDSKAAKAGEGAGSAHPQAKAGEGAGSAHPQAKAGEGAGSAHPQAKAGEGAGSAKAGEGAGSAHPAVAPVALPPKAGVRPHKKLP